MDSCQVDYVDNKLRNILNAKYNDSDIVGKILDFFYFKFSHDTPLFQRGTFPRFWRTRSRQSVHRSAYKNDDGDENRVSIGAGLMDMMNMYGGGFGSKAKGPPVRSLVVHSSDTSDDEVAF